MKEPRISFGIIVLNGAPFTRYCLRQLYPFAHQILVAEGACPGAASIARPDGHSRDGTLEELRRFAAEEDPQHKIQIITAEDEGHPDGFWPGEKDQQSRAYAQRATGDYLWQVDIDEFYRAEDMTRVQHLLAADPSITGMSFHQLQFWGGFDYHVRGWYLQRGGAAFHRLFKWGPGHAYVTHRPPTVHDAMGHDTRDGHWLDSGATRRLGLALYHYSLLFPRQVQEKCDYYREASWCQRTEADRWAREVYHDLAHPYRMHNVYAYPGWLCRFTGRHPEAIGAMRHDLAQGTLTEPLRPTQDLDRLTRSWRYRLACLGLRWLDPIEAWWRTFDRNHPATGRLGHAMAPFRQIAAGVRQLDTFGEARA